MDSDRLFFMLFLPTAAVAMFVIGPLFTFVTLQNFFAKDIIPYDLTDGLLQGVEMLQLSSLLSVALASMPHLSETTKTSETSSSSSSLSSSSLSSSSTRKHNFQLQGHVHEVPMFTQDTHFDTIKGKSGHFKLHMMEPKYRLMMKYLQKTAKPSTLSSSSEQDNQVIGFVHASPISVGSQGVLVHVKSVQEKSDGSFVALVHEGAAFEVESIRSDKTKGFFVGDVELIPDESIMFHIGQVVYDKTQDVWGVVIRADKTFKSTEPSRGDVVLASLKRGRTQPFYRVLLDNKDRLKKDEVSYMAHENLNKITPKDTNVKVTNTRLGKHFSKYDAARRIYVPL